MFHVWSKELSLKCVQVLPEGFQTKKKKRDLPFSEGCPKRRNSTVTASTVTARRKGDPKHNVEGNISIYSISSELFTSPSDVMTASLLMILRKYNQLMIVVRFQNKQI